MFETLLGIALVLWGGVGWYYAIEYKQKYRDETED